jgi:HD-GYP domain-containing protein (c-di-GMP phosphodiesterase class II)
VDLGVAPLIALEAQKPPVGQAVALEVAGEDWLGIVQPYPVWAGQDIHLVIAAPENELLGDLREKRMRLVFMIFAAILGLLPLGWLSGQMIGRSVARLTLQAERMGRFDFSTHASKPSLVKEVNELTAVMDELGGTIQTFLEISQTMATEPRVDLMLNQVLTRMVSATRCSGGVVYLWDAKANHMQIACRTGTLVGHEVAEIPHTPIAQGILIEPLMAPAGLATEKKQQEMRIELRGRGGQLQGLVVLQSAQDREHTEAAFLDFSRKLSGMLAVSIETRQLIESQKNLLDAVIRLMADAIDAKSPYTGGHCERVPELATMLADRMSADTDGPFRDFSMTEDQRYEFYLGAWLHDCGKVTSPEHIVDKATKLEVIYNRIHEVRTRFEVLWRDAEIEHLRRVTGGMDEAASHAIFAARQTQLRDDFAFVAQCNAGGEFMADALIERLRSISGQTWLRHFDNRLGLSGEESRRLTEGEPEPPALPVPEPLLADRPDHVVPWGERRPAVEKNDPNNRFGFDMVLPRYQQNMGEIYNLSIRRGTLTDEDRFKINDHIVQTLIMLKGLPWPQQLARVPEIAANHHEKMDGKGYPRRLPGDQLSVSDRIMALADIFEALTAGDRPYKAPKTLSESLKIMAFMCKDQHIDTVVFRYFLQSGLWQEFAQRFMRPEQIDAVDVAAIERLLPQEASAQ